MGLWEGLSHEITAGFGGEQSPEPGAAGVLAALVVDILSLDLPSLRRGESAQFRQLVLKLLALVSGGKPASG